jgi:predicted DNA-binding protein
MNDDHLHFTSTRITTIQHEQLQRLAKKRGKSMAEVIRLSIDLYLKVHVEELAEDMIETAVAA